MRNYLIKWIAENYQLLCESEWYDENFNGEEMESIEPDFFIETYLLPLISSNIYYDFGAEINAAKLLGERGNDA